MSATKILILVFVSLPTLSFSQNLVNNPGFESLNSCPTIGAITVNGWYPFTNSPDFFNTCATSCSFPSSCQGVPNNFSGYQWPYEGNSYAGIVTFHMALSSYREYLGTELITPLIIGTRYFVSAYICRADAYFSRGASNKLGFRFSNIEYSDVTPVPLDNFCHIYSDSILTDSVNWFKLSGSFIADSSYRYLIIANFFDDQHTDTLDMFNDQYNHAYYYIDNVCVSEDSLYEVHTSIENIPNQNVNIYPSPFQDKLNIEIENNESAEVRIYDILNRKVEQLKFTRSVSLNTNNFKNGIYFYIIKNLVTGNVSSGKVTKY